MAKRKLRVQDAEKWLVLSDPHYPFQNKPYIKAIKRFAQDLEPDAIVINGDGLDFYDLSRFNKNPKRQFKLKEEIAEYHGLLAHGTPFGPTLPYRREPRAACSHIFVAPSPGTFWTKGYDSTGIVVRVRWDYATVSMVAA